MAHTQTLVDRANEEVDRRYMDTFLQHSSWGRICRDCNFWRGPYGQDSKGCPHVNVHALARACEHFYPQVRRDTTP
jgi:hypothetical protein